MGGNKHKQTKKKPAKLVRDRKNKKDPSGSDKDKTDPSLDPGHHCCLPVGNLTLLVHYSVNSFISSQAFPASVPRFALTLKEA